MPVEVCSYRLTLRGKPAGTHVLKTEGRGRHTQLEGRAQFQGPLGLATVQQRSRCHAQRHFSLRFREETQERNEQRVFDVTFDNQLGLVTATKGAKDVARMPYLRPYRDPLSILHELRSLGEVELAHMPMLGKDVTVQFVGEHDLDTAFGKKRARVYLLHPGQSVVYVDVTAPHTILKLTQRLPDGHLDALLVKVSSEPSLEPFDESGGGEKSGKSGKRRSRRRRPRRRRKS